MVDFIVNNYILIIIIAAFLIFALIGYAVDVSKNGKKQKEEDEVFKESGIEEVSKEEEKEDNSLEIPDVNEKK